ncbi:condensation domain-containing protein, partial [Undibacterium sp. 5I1]
MHQRPLDAYTHQDLPFEKIVEVAQPVRSMNHNVLFQTMLSLDNTPSSGRLILPGLHLSPAPAPIQTTQFDLSLTLMDSHDALSGLLEYSTDLFDHGTIERLIGHLQTVLSGMITDDEQYVSQIPLLTPSQRQHIRTKFNNTAVDFPRDLLIHQLFEQQAAAHP